MKIAYIVHGYVNSGGTERILATKANYFIANGYDVSIISMDKEGVQPFFTFSSGIKFYHLRLSGKEKNNRTLFLSKVSPYLQEINPDISITMGMGASQYLYEVKDRSKKIFEYHFSKYKRKFELASLDKFVLGRIITDIYTYNRTRIAKKYDRFIVLTEEDKESWRHIPNIRVIANPLSFVTDKKSDLLQKRVIAVGRYTYQKGYDWLIKIWVEINKKYPDWKLSLFGSGKKKSYLENLIRRFNLEGAIELNPPHSDIEKEYLNSSISVMTSRYEGFGLVLPEAMSCGLPIVAYACKCGPKDIIRDGEDGFLIGFKDKKEFIEKLSLLMENYEVRQHMGKNAQKNMQRYKDENVMPQWIKLFDELTK